jgi:cell division protein FtsW
MMHPARTLDPGPPVAVRGGADRVLFIAAFLLLLLGVLAVYTASAAVSLDRYGSPHHVVLRHALHAVVGLAALLLFARLDYRKLDSPAIANVGWALALVALVLCFAEAPAGGARRWLRLGELSVQPSELAKLVVVVLVAFHLSRRKEILGDPWRGLLPPMLFAGSLAALVALQPDFGTAAFLLLLCALLALVAGTPWRVLAAHAAAGVTALAFFVVQEPYRLARLRSFLDPTGDPLGSGFQLRQSLIALGTGGLVGRSHDGPLGTGLGCSLQKLFYLPEPHTDFVFAVFGEELGLAGTLLVVALFVVVLVRGLTIAAHAAEMFGALIATGCTALLALQALVNILVVVGLLPTKGVPLPFLSYGGSSLVVSCAALGLLLSVSRHG